MSQALNDKPVALVTGSGAARVGRAVATTLGKLGYQLVLHANRSISGAREAAKQFTAAGMPAIALQANVSDEAAVKAMFATVHDEFGRIDALVNCAAIWERKPLDQVTADDLRRHFEINVLGTFLCCQHGGLMMVGQEAGGGIVNFGDWAIERPYLHYAAYFPSKGAIPALTRSFAVELASRNPRVRVNAVLPGPVMLPPDLSPQEREAAIRGTLLKREGSPQNVAEAVAFLLSNDFITGVCLPVDGGRTIAGSDTN